MPLHCDTLLHAVTTTMPLLSPRSHTALGPRSWYLYSNYSGSGCFDVFRSMVVYVHFPDRDKIKDTNRETVSS